MADDAADFVNPGRERFLRFYSFIIRVLLPVLEYTVYRYAAVCQFKFNDTGIAILVYPGSIIMMHDIN